MDYSNYQMPTKPSTNTFEKAALVMGIISLITSVLCFSAFAPAIGGLGVIFAILSKGKNPNYGSTAKKGLTMSVTGMVLGTVISIIVIVMSFITLFQTYEPDQLHQYLNEAYEQYYGESFDEMYEDIYGQGLDF